MAALDRWRLWARDAANQNVRRIDGHRLLSLVPAYSGIGAWSVEVPTSSPAVDVLMEPGARFAAFVRGKTDPVLTGFVDYVAGVGGQEDDGDWLTFSGPDDNTLLWERIIYPDEDKRPDEWTSAQYTLSAATPSAAMRDLVVWHLLAGWALPERGVNIGIGADPALGTSQAWGWRLQVLGDELLRIGEATDIPILFRINDLAFELTAPTDLTGGPAKISAGLGNLGPWTYTRMSPTATAVIVGGQGEGAARAFREVNDVAQLNQAGRRIERYADRRDIPTAADLVPAGREVLALARQQETLSVEIIDTDQLSWPEDYDIGAKVVGRAAGRIVEDVIREMMITVDDEGEKVTPTIGWGTTLDGVGILTQAATTASTVQALGAAQ